jgi:hypothetical protein
MWINSVLTKSVIPLHTHRQLMPRQTPTPGKGVFSLALFLALRGEKAENEKERERERENSTQAEQQTLSAPTRPRHVFFFPLFHLFLALLSPSPIDT